MSCHTLIFTVSFLVYIYSHNFFHVVSNRSLMVMPMGVLVIASYYYVL